MIAPGTGVKVYIACGTTDMRRGIQGLSAAAQDVLKKTHAQKPSSPFAAAKAIASNFSIIKF